MTKGITIEDIKRLDAARTQGDWRKVGGTSDCLYGVDNKQEPICDDCFSRDAEFIAAAPAIAAKCIQQSEELERLNEECEKHIDDKAQQYNKQLNVVQNLNDIIERMREALLVCEDIFNRKRGAEEEDSGYHACKKGLGRERQ